MDPNDIRPQPIEAEAVRLEIEHAPPAGPAAASPVGPATTAASATGPGRGMSLRRMAGTLLLAGGLLAVGGASVAMAASPQPSASTSPSTQGGPGSHGYGSGAMPGGCQHKGSGTNGSSGGSSSPSSTSGA